MASLASWFSKPRREQASMEPPLAGGWSVSTGQEMNLYLSFPGSGRPLTHSRWSRWGGSESSQEARHQDGSHPSATTAKDADGSARHGEENVFLERNMESRTKSVQGEEA